MNPLMSLLGQQAGIPAASAPGVQYDEFGNMIGIGVSGATTRPQPTPNPEGGSLPNVRDLLNVQKDVAESEEASDRKGMFGVKGTLRDILGLVGDAFLVQGGRNPIYAPQRQKERVSDAMAGFSRGGEDAIAAAERVGYYEPELGRDLLKEAQATDLARTTGQLKGRTEDRQGFDDATKRISQAYAAVMQNPTPEVAAYALQLARNESETLGIPLERLGVTENMTQDVMRVLAGRGATVSQTMEQPLKERRTAVSEGQLDVAKQRLEVSLRGVQDRERRTQIAEETLGMRRDDQRFGRLMDLFDISLDTEKLQDKKKPTGPRQVPTTPAASRFRPASN